MENINTLLRLQNENVVQYSEDWSRSTVQVLRTTIWCSATPITVKVLGLDGTEGATM